MAEPITLTPDQESEFNRQATAEPVSLSPDQEAEFNRQAGASPGAALDPLRDFTPDQLVSLSVQDPDNFNLVREFANRKDISSDPALVSKTADALARLKDRGFQLSDLPGPGKVAGTLWDIAKGFGKQAWNYASAASIPFSSLYGKVTGQPDEYYDELGRQAQRGIAENWAGTESAVTGAAGMVKRAAGKLIRQTEPKTEEQKVAELFDDAAAITQQQEIAKGKGEFLGAVGGEVVKELEQRKTPVRPEEVEKLAAGDPFSWYAMGKGFALLPGASAAERVAAKAGVQSARAAGKTIETAADITQLGANAVAKVAPATGAIIGATKGAGIGFGAPGAFGGLYAGYRAGQVVAKGAKKVGEAAETAAGVGEQIAGKAPMVSNVAQLGKDIAESAPGAALDVVRGAGFDIGLAAATSETPEETAGVGVGTAFGALGAGRRVGGRALSGQIIAPREYGIKNPVASSGQFPVLDRLHSDAISSATPGVAARLNAIRAFTKGAAPNADIFLAKDGPAAESALKQVGVDEATAKAAGESEGFFRANVVGKDGQPRTIIVARNVESAPHEAFHAIQDIIGEAGNQAIDEQVKSAYGKEWEAIGNDYAQRLRGPLQGADWRETVLDASGWGRSEAAEKIYDSIFEDSKKVSAGEPDPAEVRKVANAEWLRLVHEAATRNGTSLDAAQNAVWRDVLSPTEASAVADRYIAREIAAENFDAVFKGSDQGLERPGFLPKAANIVGKLVSALGGEPLAGRTSAVGQYPLKFETAKAVQAAAKPAVVPKEVSPTPAAKPTISFGIPSTPEGKAAAAEEAKAIAETAPDTIQVGGTKSDRELLGAVAEAIAQQSGVKINYLSAPDEPAAATTSNRNTRRAIIEVFRTMPAAARSLWEKTFFPERVIKTKSGYQVMGWAPEVFAANAHKLAQTLSDVAARGGTFDSPYELDPANRTFSEQGWKDLYADAQTFVKNQVSGRTGAGETLVVPKELPGVFKPAETGRGTGLEQRKADFINTLFNFKLPETPRITGKKLPLTIVGQEVSAATKPGRVELPVRPRGEFTGEKAEQLGIAGREILEVNPLRNELEKAAQENGLPMPSFIEAIQKLNLANIKEVELAPEQPEFRGNTLTLTAGFQPKANFEHSWLDPEGKFHPGYGDHAYAAKGITGIANPSDAYYTLLGRGWKRVRREGGILWASGQGPEPLTKAQKSALEEVGIDNELTVKHDIHSGAPRTIYAPPAGELIGGQFLPSAKADRESIREAAIRTPQGIFTGMLHALAEQAAEKAGAAITTTLPADSYGFITSTGRFVNRIEAAKIAAEAEQLPTGKTSFQMFSEKPMLAAEDLSKAQFSPARQAAEKLTTMSPEEFGELRSFRGRFGGGGTGWAYEQGASVKSPEDLAAFTQAREVLRELAKNAQATGDLTQAIFLQTKSMFAREAYEAATGHQIDKPGEEGSALRGIRHYDPEYQPPLAPKEAEGTSQFMPFAPDRYYTERGLPIPARPEEAAPLRGGRQAEKVIKQPPRVGKEFTQFFSDVSAGRFGKSGVPFQPEQDLTDVAAVDEARQKYASNFENHIDRSIPMHYEEKTRKIDGVVKSYPEGGRILDIAGSEGDFGKTISDLSGGKIETVTLDPNEEMAKRFSEKPQTEGATYAKEAWLNGFDDAGKHYPAHKPEQPYDLINESVGFQFIDPDRKSQIAEVKQQLKPDGIFLTMEKVKNPNWKENEGFKDSEFKSKYWKDEDLKQKETRVGFSQSKAEQKAVGMLDNMVTDSELESVLKDNFSHVVQYFDSGNFKGYAASDSREKLDALVSNIGDLNSKFSTVETPREVSQFAPKKSAWERQKDREEKERLRQIREQFGSYTDEPTPEQTKVLERLWKENNLARFTEYVQEKRIDPTNVVSQFMPKKKEPQERLGWMSPSAEWRGVGEGEAHSDAATRIAEDLKLPIGDDPIGYNERAQDAVKANGWLRILPYGSDTLLAEGKSITEKQKTELENRAIEQGFEKVMLDTGTARPRVIWEESQFAPKKKEGKFTEEQIGKAQVSLKPTVLPSGEKAASSETDWKLKPGAAGFSKAWITPAGQPIQLGGQWHHDYLNENEALRERYGIPTSESAEDNRVDALKKGFARINYGINNGTLTVEARLKDWRKLKPAVERFVEENLGKVDNMTVSLTDETAQKVLDSDSVRLFNIPKEDRMDNLPFITGSEPRGSQYQPKVQGELLAAPERKEYDKARVVSMTPAELRDHFPEAVVREDKFEPIPADILNSPLAKQAGNEEAAVSAFADKMVEFSNQYKDHPAFKAGSEWYPEFSKRLKAEFGADAPLFAELLAATSPNTSVTTNFGYAIDALQSYKAGRFDKKLKKFEQGLNKIDDGSWAPWIKREIKSGNVENAPVKPTQATFMAQWILKHDLKPLQSNGKLYGIHSVPVLQVFARRWLDKNTGLKTANFVSNLIGSGHEATIDLWANRTMRRLGYSGFEPRWRILPSNNAAVSDPDFAFAQKVFRAAAEKMKMNPDDLQGALWFAEKQNWWENGWGSLDLGSFSKEMERLPALRAGFEQRTAKKQPEMQRELIQPRKLK